jgi:hypothetical protein
MSDDPETVARLITEVTTAVDRHGYAETLRRDQ